MKKIYFFAIVLLAAFAFACGGSSVDSAMSQVEKALDRVEKNKVSMTQADWQALEAELEAPLQTLATALENKQVGTLKRLELMALTARVAAVFMEAGMNTVINEMDAAEVLPEDLERAAEQLEQATPADTGQSE